jgi:hypothetical protein
MLEVYPRSKLAAKDQRRYANRLLQLMDYLKRIKPERYRHDCLVDVERYRSDGGVPKNSCGTVACAFGHAVISGKFPHMGLTIRAWHPNPKVNRKDHNYRGSEDIVSMKTNSGKHLSSEKEANKFFGPGSWEHIFDSHSDNYPGYGRFSWDGYRVTRQVVIARIEKFVKESYNTTCIR